MAISPTQVSLIQKKLAETLQRPIELVIKSQLTQTVAALDAYSQVMEENLNGNFIQKAPNPRVLQAKITDSIIRNYLVNAPGNTLFGVRLLQKTNKPLVVATIAGIISPPIEAIQKLEILLRKKLGEPELDLIVRFLKLDLYDREGRVRFELTGFVDLTIEQEEAASLAIKLLEEWFKADPELFLSGINYTLIDDTFNFYLETTGTQVFPISSVNELERSISKKTGQQINVFVLSSIDTVATSNGYESYGNFSRRIVKKVGPKRKNDMRKIIENTYR